MRLPYQDVYPETDCWFCLGAGFHGGGDVVDACEPCEGLGVFIDKSITLDELELDAAFDRVADSHAEWAEAVFAHISDAETLAMIEAGIDGAGPEDRDAMIDQRAEILARLGERGELLFRKPIVSELGDSRSALHKGPHAPAA